jgi:hypothetical protein
MCKSDKSLYSIRIETKRKNVSSDNLIDIFIWYGHQCSVPPLVDYYVSRVSSDQYYVLSNRHNLLDILMLCMKTVRK